MKSAQELITEIEKMGVSIGLDTDGVTLRIEAPKGTLTDDMKSALTVHKKDIVQTLKDTREAYQPYINEQDVLIIPFDSEPRFHWWAGGQTIIETLRELDASPEVIVMYGPAGTV